MRIPRLPARPRVAVAAVVAAAAILIATGVGNTHATEPTNQQVDENTPGGTAVGTPLNASATGTTVSYALSGTDATSFTINPATGEVSLAPDVSPDFEAKSQYSLTVTATADVIVQVLNVDEPGTVALSTHEPGAGETITAALTDPDGGMTNVRWSWARSDGDGWNDLVWDRVLLPARYGRPAGASYSLGEPIKSSRRYRTQDVDPPSPAGRRRETPSD